MTKLLDITGKALSGEWGIDDDNGNGIPVLRTTNFTNEGIVDLTNVVTRKINKNNIEYKYLRKGDIIIEKSGGSDKQPVGRVVYFDGPENIYLFNNFTGLLRIKNRKKWLPKYIFYSLYFNYRKGGTRRFENKTTGLHNLKIDDYVSKYDVKDISISLQTTMCNILDKIQEDINIIQIQVSKYDELIKARFIEMFGDPEENPFNWKKILLAKVIINANNGMARRGNDNDGNIVMRLVELQDGYIDYSNPNRIILKDNEKKRYLLKDKDFLFARVNGNPDNVGRCAVFHDIGEDVYHNDHIIRVHFDEELLNGTFASALFNSDYGKKQLKSQIKTSAGQYTVSQDGIGAIATILPPAKLQNQFADFVQQVDKSRFDIKKSIIELEREVVYD